MTDAAALLRTVLAAPDDDAPRLIYADWLDEHATSDGPCPLEFCEGGYWRHSGDPNTRRAKCHVCRGGIMPGNGFAERAEFVRLQIDIERNDSFRAPESDPRRRRERALWNVLPTCKVFAPWADGIAIDPVIPDFWIGDMSGPMCRVRRGFVQSVSCTAADCLAHLDAILASHPVQEVRLVTAPTVWWDWQTQAGRVRATWHPLADAMANTPGAVEAVLRAEWPSVRTWHLPPGQRAEMTDRPGRAAGEAMENADERLSAAPPDNARRRAGHSRLPGWLAERRQRPTRPR